MGNIFIRLYLFFMFKGILLKIGHILSVNKRVRPMTDAYLWIILTFAKGSVMFHNSYCDDYMFIKTGLASLF